MFVFMAVDFLFVSKERFLPAQEFISLGQCSK